MNTIFAKMRQEYKPTFLKSEPFINCCGCNIAAYFPQGSERDYEVLKPRLKKELKYVLDKQSNSMMLIILNHKQAKYFDEDIRELGFRCLMRDVHHPNHGNNLSLYGWEKHEKKAPRDATF